MPPMRPRGHWILTFDELPGLGLGGSLELVHDHLAFRMIATHPGGTPPGELRMSLIQRGGAADVKVPERPADGEWLVPWATARLDDAWLLLVAGVRRYWLELPYGMCGAPATFADETPQLGPPRLPADLTPEDTTVGWEAIRFELGVVSGWQVTALASSRKSGELALAVERDGGPPPVLTIAAAWGSRSIPVHRVHDWDTHPPNGHVARFAFPRAAIRARSYCRVVVAGDEIIGLELPTSLTDPEHRAASLGRLTNTI